MKLKLSDLTKRCGEKEALSHFSYTFENGIYGILGANGTRHCVKNILFVLSSVLAPGVLLDREKNTLTHRTRRLGQK